MKRGKDDEKYWRKSDFFLHLHNNVTGANMMKSEFLSSNTIFVWHVVAVTIELETPKPINQLVKERSGTGRGKRMNDSLLLDKVAYSCSALSGAAFLLRSNQKVKVQLCCKCLPSLKSLTDLGEQDKDRQQTKNCSSSRSWFLSHPKALRKDRALIPLIRQQRVKRYL